MKLTVVTQPPSRVKADLAVAVLDPDKTLCKVDQPELRRVLQAAQRAFKEERQKRELFHSFPGQSPIKNLLVFSTTLSKNYDLQENLKIFAAKSLIANKYTSSKKLCAGTTRSSWSAVVTNVAG